MNKARKGSKMHTYPKWRNSTVFIFADEVIELSVFADEMLVYVENPRSLWKKKIHGSNKWVQDHRYKVKM